MKTFTIAITTMCLIASPLVANATASAAPPVGARAVPLSKSVTTPAGNTFRVTKLKGGKVLLKPVGVDATRVSVVIDPGSSKVTYKAGWIRQILDWIIARPQPKDEGTPCARATIKAKSKDGTEIEATTETGNCPKQ